MGRPPSRRLEAAGQVFEEEGLDDEAECSATSGAPPRLTPGQAPTAQERRTTVILQRIAYDLDEAGVGRVLEERGLGAYDAIHVPRSRRHHTNLAYAFVNFSAPEDAVRCISLCTGRPFGESDPPKHCVAEFSFRQGADFVSRCLDNTLSNPKIRGHNRGTRSLGGGPFVPPGDGHIPCGSVERTHPSADGEQ
mmetsp:Transcript_22977/g.64545  ORF Transcript_22977/g.64545 Transcript_22977/m.64545 type:complete len:193 (-) Transcript_22977:218-796(-)